MISDEMLQDEFPMILVEERASRLRGIRGREWGGEEEIAALAACLGVSIRVHDVGRNQAHTYSPPSGIVQSRMIHLRYDATHPLRVYRDVEPTQHAALQYFCRQPQFHNQLTDLAGTQGMRKRHWLLVTSRQVGTTTSSSIDDRLCCVATRNRTCARLRRYCTQPVTH
eukprot:SAG11_NODE_2137_length_3766_cov_2.253613_5_plen_168_part_00